MDDLVAESGYEPSNPSSSMASPSSPDGSVPEEMTASTETFNSSGASSESYLTLPEEILSLTSIAELEEAVFRCREMVIELPDDHSDKKHLVRRLIELRKRLHEVEEAQEDGKTLSLLDKPVVLGHHFQRQNLPKSLVTHYCDRCSGVIWNALHSWYLCLDCDYKCHDWCLKQVCRVCAHVVVSESPDYVNEICPEAADGLSSQNYRCAECLTRTSHRVSTLTPRRCDYNGKYYCPTCHWNSTSIIPARVINNWDFSKRPVCRATKQHLKLLANLPNVPLERLNPVLFASVDELIDVKKTRQRLLFMKKYLTSCKTALETNLAWQLKDRLHFLENDDRYSLQDLEDVRSGALLPNLNKLIELFEKHITQECQVCKGQGFFCEFCRAEEERRKKVIMIFPFEATVKCCPDCGAAFHLACWLHYQEKCPKCTRKLQRKATEGEGQGQEVVLT